jgi:hypothetical protein
MSVQLTKFPSLSERERITTLRKYQKLYENEQYVVLGLHEIIKKQYKNLSDLVYLAHAIPARISEFYGDFVAGDVENLIIEAGTGVDEDEELMTEIVYENDLKEKIFDYAVSQSEFGFCVLLGRVDEDGIYHIDEVPEDQYFPQRDGSVVFATYKKDPEDKTGKRLLLYTQHYSLVGEDVIIERQAFNTDDNGVASSVYDLTKMALVMGKTVIEPSSKIEGLGELPIRQIDNSKRNKYQFGKSDYADILPQLAEVNERSTQVSTQFLKNLDAKLVIPTSVLDEDGKLKNAEVFALENKEEILPQFVTNTNSMITEAREHMLSELKFVSFITGVPMFELLKSSMPERVEALRIQLFSAIRKTTRKRSKITRALKDMLRIGFKMKERELEEDPVIKFSDVLPRDENTEATTEATKVGAGLSSRRSSIMRLEGISEEEAEKELEQLNLEATMAGVIDTTQPPQI